MLPGPKMYIKMKMKRYSKAISLAEKGSLACTTNAATIIVKIIGIIESL